MSTAVLHPSEAVGGKLDVLLGVARGDRHCHSHTISASREPLSLQ